ncbi:MAG: cyclase family protein [Candidatus Sericytochromatia bacterium]|nr:cyclase family protein [Candidatus Sericytochromatia bacterium]
MTGLTLRAEVAGTVCSVRLDSARVLAYGLDFAGRQAGAFGLPRATVETVRAGSFTGEPAEGGSCRCEVLTLIPHAHGTHTEGIGHLADRPLPVHRDLVDVLVPATLVSPTFDDATAPLTAEVLRRALEPWPASWREAVVIRLAPPMDGPRDWSGLARRFITAEAAGWLREQGCRHVVTDLPSLEPEWDGGALAAHRAFWGLGAGERPTGGSAHTITEMAWLPAALPDGIGLLNLQIAPFDRDAAPARPVWLPVSPAA